MGCRSTGISRTTSNDRSAAPRPRKTEESVVVTYCSEIGAELQDEGENLGMQCSQESGHVIILVVRSGADECTSRLASDLFSTPILSDLLFSVETTSLCY
jgi:hypothetical protein